ncbi:hypothetical protein FKP32DRAFT_1671557 [Trametes sanguinea]|nr:hypothetical protein FKP32DRAFT_1671557 [Trametes sanguinea]
MEGLDIGTSTLPSPNSFTREHLVVHDVGFSIMQGDATASPWTIVSVNLLAVRNSADAANIAYWALGMYPQASLQRPQIVYLTGDDWSIQWVEPIKLLMFYRNSGVEPSNVPIYRSNALMIESFGALRSA